MTERETIRETKRDKERQRETKSMTQKAFLKYNHGFVEICYANLKPQYLKSLSIYFNSTIYGYIVGNP